MDKKMIETCRICLDENGYLISPCACSGSVSKIHVTCMIKESMSSGKAFCTICKSDYKHSVINDFLVLLLECLNAIEYIGIVLTNIALFLYNLYNILSEFCFLY